MKKRIFFYILLMLQITLSAQQRTHIPYSIYGIGKILPQGFGRNIGMGRTGIALSSSRYINNINPASYTSIDSVSFFFDFGLSSDFVSYKTRLDPTQKGTDFNMRNLAIGFRISKNWASSIGIVPYTSVGYKIETRELVDGKANEYFDVTITGNGGLNQFYWANSYKFFDHLSLGVNFAYLFGTIESVETVNAQSLTNDNNIKTTSYLNKLYADFGVQYNFMFKDDYEVTLGGIFGNKHRLNFEDKIQISDASGSIYYNEITDQGTFELPFYTGGGLAVTYKNRLTVSADYIYHDWSNTSSGSMDYKYRSNNTFRFGFEWIPGRYAKLGYFGGISYRAGFYYEESYLEIKNKKTSDKGLTVGLGLPFLQNKTSVNISYNYGINGTIENNLIKENYHSIMMSLTLHDWWFIKRKID